MHRGLTPGVTSTSEIITIGKEVRRLVVFIGLMLEIYRYVNKITRLFTKIAVIC